MLTGQVFIQLIIILLAVQVFGCPSLDIGRRRCESKNSKKQVWLALKDY